MESQKKPRLSTERRRQIVSIWPRIGAGEIADIEQALAAIPIEKGDPEYVIVRAMLSLFLERGPTLSGNFDIYTEMAYLFTEVILEGTPPGVAALMHVAAIPTQFHLPLLAYLVDRPEDEIEPIFEQLTETRIVKVDSNGAYWLPPTFRDCLLLHWLRPQNQARYVEIQKRLIQWERVQVVAA